MSGPTDWILRYIKTTFFYLYINLSALPAFRKLLNNYEVETGQPEEVTLEEQVENCHFIDLLVETDVMREAHRILVAKGKAPEEEDDFKRKLYDIWFRLYRRSRYDK